MRARQARGPALSWAGVTKAAKLAFCTIAVGLAALALRGALRSSAGEGLAEVGVTPAGDAAAVPGMALPGASVAATPEQRASSADDHREPLASERDDVPIPLEEAQVESFRLRGRVVDDTGAPLVGAKLRFAGPGGLQIKMTARDGGWFGPLRLAAGSFEVTARCSGHRAASERGSLSGVPGEREIELRLEALPIVAVHARAPGGESYLEAVDAGVDRSLRSTVKSFLAIATVEPPPAILPVKLGGKERDFGIGSWLEKHGPGDRVGELRVDAAAEYHVSLVLGPSVIVTQRVALGAQSVTFVLEPAAMLAVLGSVRGRFVDESGTPMTEVLATLRSDPKSSRSGRPDSEGRFRFDGLHASALLLRVIHPVHVQREFDLRAGEALDLGDLVLGGDGIAIVRIEGPPSDANVCLGRVDLNHGTARMDWKTLWPVALGTCEFTALEPGTHAVGIAPAMADDRLGSRLVPFEFVDGATVEITLRLEPCGDLVLEPAGDSSIGARYLVRDEATGLVNRAGTIVEPFPETLRLPRGPWLVELELLDGTRLTRSVLLGVEPEYVALPR